MIVVVKLAGQRLDLFNDEQIEIVSSINDSSDISKNTTDYSKSFTVPASDTNNAIFKHYYNADIDNGFDARVKIDATIELDYLPFKDGKIRLEKVNVKSGKASSYSIVFFGKLVSLKDRVKDDEISSLDLSDLNHVHNSANVLTGLQQGLFDSKLIYNLLSKRRFFYNTEVSDVTDTPTQVNIANVGMRWNEIRPSIKLIEIIKAIEVKYNFNFSNDFFGREEFDKLYMWCSNNAEINGVPTEQLINWDGGNGADFGLSNATDTWENSTFFNSNGNRRVFNFKVSINTVNTEPYQVVVKNNNVVIATLQSEGGNFVSEFVEIKTVDLTDFSIKFYLRSTSSMTYTASVDLKMTEGFLVFNKTSTASSNNIIAIYQIAENLPKIKVIDFLTSLFKMFKLVVIQNDNSEIYINSLVDFYTQGKTYDITNYVDFESYDVNRGEILNEIDFTFETPTTLLNSQFKLNTSLGYGDEQLKLTDENGDLLDGKKLDVKPNFEQIVYERLTNTETGEQTNIMYGLIADAELKPQNPKAHIFYNNIQNVTDLPFKFINDANVTQTIVNNLNIPSHTLGFGSPQFSTIFSEEFNEWDGSLISNTLYTNYYKDYIESIFNIKRRNFKFKAHLPLHILLGLRLNDVLKIKENYYRIDKYTCNITNGEVSLELINSFDAIVNGFGVGQTIIFTDFREGTNTIFARGDESLLVTVIGATYATATINDRLISVFIEENTTTSEREFTVEIVSGKELINVLVSQGKNPEL